MQHNRTSKIPLRRQALPVERTSMPLAAACGSFRFAFPPFSFGGTVGNAESVHGRNTKTELQDVLWALWVHTSVDKHGGLRERSLGIDLPAQCGHW